ncbi:MAG TPA: hypothetical protein VGJ30_12155 [Candidatus Angelobacter sp.]|jgi:hypothetical protein
MYRKISMAFLVVACSAFVVVVASKQFSTSANGNMRASAAMPLASRVAVDPIQITSPTDGATVPERPFVEGTVSDPNATVWVVIHPMEVSDYWVQPKTSMRGGGRWKVQVYAGRPGTPDVGKHFEIRAVANPKQPLREGIKLTDWPNAQLQSPIIEVVRGK